MSIKMQIKMPIKMSIKMAIKMSIKMSIKWNPILGTQRCPVLHFHDCFLFASPEPNFRYTTILLKKMKENDNKCTKTYTKHTHIPQNYCFSKILVSRGCGAQNAKSLRKIKQNCSILTFFTAAAEPVKKKRVFLKIRQGFSVKVQLFK